tara:strand:- start:189 stop:695 length:507 start_codon:yes stop_codon:yes gene_type:complete
MAYIYKKLTGANAQTLFQGHYNLKSIHIANIHVTDSVQVDLYLQDKYPGNLNTDPTINEDSTSAFDYYIVKGLTIPYRTSIILEERDLEYDTNYNLVISLNASDSAVDLIIKDHSDVNSARSPHVRESSSRVPNVSKPYGKVLHEGGFKEIQDSYNPTGAAYESSIDE